MVGMRGSNNPINVVNKGSDREKSERKEKFDA